MKTLRFLLLFIALWGSAAVAQVANSGHAADAGSVAPDAGGTVTSVGLALPASTFSVSGSPVTTSGTLTGAFVTQTANTVFSGPTTGIAAVPTWRALVPADIPAGVATVAITDDTTTNATMYPTWVTANTGNLPIKVSSTKMSFNPSTGKLTVAGGLLDSALTAGRVTFAGTAGLLSDSANLTFTDGTTTGQLIVPVGAVGTPSVTFLGRTTNGLYSPAANTVDMAINGAVNARFVTTHLLLGGLTTDGTGVLQFPAATTSAGGITFGTDTFLYRSAAAVFNVENSSTAQTLRLRTTGGRNLDMAVNDTGNVVSILDSGMSGNATFTIGSQTAGRSLLLDAGSSTASVTISGGATPTVQVNSTGTVKFGATAAATIGVSADTTAGELQITSPSSGATFLSRNTFKGINTYLSWNGSGGTATTNSIIGDGSTSLTFAPGSGTALTMSGSAALTLTGGAGNWTQIAGTGNSRTMTFQTTTSGGTATNAVVLDATQGATFTNVVNSTTGQHTATVTGTGGASYGGIAPITLYVKSVTVLTAGTPADIATITIPAGITRWAVFADTGGNFTLASGFIGETAAGTLAGASFAAYDAADGGGLLIADATSGPGAAGTLTGFTLADSYVLSTSSTLKIRQTANSANAGTVSFYITIYPLP